MNHIANIAATLLYRSKSNVLSNSRLTMLIYLCDWKSCLVTNKPLTELNWHYENNGPFSWEVIKAVIYSRKHFEISKSLGSFISFNTTVKLIVYNEEIQNSLSSYSNNIIDFVIKQTNALDNEQFTNLILSTYPVMSSQKFTDLNLKRLSVEYKSSRLWSKDAASLELGDL